MGFETQGDELCLKPEYRVQVRFLEQDIRERTVDGLFDLILCRNLVFTYVAPSVQIDIARRMAQVLVSRGLLLLGAHESLPAGVPTLETERPWLYRRQP